MSGNVATRLGMIVAVSVVTVAGCSTSYWDSNKRGTMTIARATTSSAVPEAAHLHTIVELRRVRRVGVTPSEDNFIWMGRHLAYVGEFESAVDEFTIGLEHYPDSYKLLRHRGHRWITLRHFDRAVDDLSRAASLIEHVQDQTEPDGLPNKAGIPRSTSHTNIHYHLGLAHYLRGDFEKALRAYETCMRFVRNDDMHVATAYWMYLTQKRLGRDEEARRTLEPILAQMEVIENQTYHDLLMLYRSADDLVERRRGALPRLTLMSAKRLVDASPNDATAGYGVGMLHLLHGRIETSVGVFREVIETGNPAAFGFIAAEVELGRLPLE